MLSIQQAGSEILGGSPRIFYAMTGSEYGIKSSYINTLKSHFGEQKEVSSVKSVISMFQTKHLFPPSPAVYVVRYDEEFIADLSDRTASIISNLKCNGCIVCLYEQDKHEAKLDKYIGDYTVHVGKVDDRFVTRYLHTDFPNLPDKLIDEAVAVSENYGHAKNIARLMTYSDVNTIFKLSPSEISDMFGVNTTFDDYHVRLGVASRNYKYLVKLLDNYTGQLDSFIYSILSTMVELEKCMVNRYADSELRQYLKGWEVEDVYNMFMNTYQELNRLRTYSQDTYSSILFLISLLQFRRIPDAEVFK